MPLVLRIQKQLASGKNPVSRNKMNYKNKRHRQGKLRRSSPTIKLKRAKTHTWMMSMISIKRVDISRACLHSHLPHWVAKKLLIHSQCSLNKSLKKRCRRKNLKSHSGRRKIPSSSNSNKRINCQHQLHLSKLIKKENLIQLENSSSKPNQLWRL